MKEPKERRLVSRIYTINRQQFRKISNLTTFCLSVGFVFNYIKVKVVVLQIGQKTKRFRENSCFLSQIYLCYNLINNN